MKLNRLIYKSIASPKTMEEENISNILETSIKHNKSHGINGLLLLSGNYFLQVLEGPSKFINELYKNIVNDERHHDVQLLLYESISESYFSDWSMRLIEIDKVSMPVYKMLLKKYPHDGKIILFPENKLLLYSLLQDALYFAKLHDKKES